MPATGNNNYIKQVIYMSETTFEKIQDSWNAILTRHKEDFELQDVTFEMFINPLRLVSLDGNTIKVTASLEESVINLINKKYLSNLQLSFCEYLGDFFNLVIISDTNNTSPAPKEPEKKTFVPAYDEKNFRLNPNYTFEKFIKGPNNDLAHTVALAVAEAPSKNYNPLFIHGGVGLGKTHLMQAIAHRIIENFPEKKVLYVTSETFTNELIDNLSSRKNNISFRNKYRNIDVLLIDDIQFVIGKESTQEEFFHTFNDLYQYNKQIVLTSDRPPKDMDTLPERLKTRFSEGMICDIQIPSYETKRAILNQKIEDRYLSDDIPDDVRDYIAKNIKSSIRELEGSINTLQAYANLNHSKITLDLAMEALKDLVSSDHNKVITPDLILNIVAEHFNISAEDILSNKRSAEITYPRQIVMYLCRQMTKETAKDIGAFLGNRDHSTILHGAKIINNDILNDDNIKVTIEILMNKIDPS